MTACQNVHHRGLNNGWRFECRRRGWKKLQGKKSKLGTEFIFSFFFFNHNLQNKSSREKLLINLLQLALYVTVSCLSDLHAVSVWSGVERSLDLQGGSAVANLLLKIQISISTR